MGPLMPQVLRGLTEATGAGFELMILENSLFGPAVTTAGLLPGETIRRTLQERGDLDLALLPAEAVNDDLAFIDDVKANELAAGLPMEVRLSYDFADALGKRGTRNAERVTVLGVGQR